MVSRAEAQEEPEGNRCSLQPLGGDETFVLEGPDARRLGSRGVWVRVCLCGTCREEPQTSRIILNPWKLHEIEVAAGDPRCLLLSLPGTGVT